MIPYGHQSINENDIRAVSEVLRGDWLTIGPLVEVFENELSKIVGAPCISVSSGTAALHCAFASIGLERGDEIITPPITFIATQATAALMGAKIVFADVLPDTANINPRAVEAVITPRTKAIVAVDFAGHPADLDELRVIADKHGIYLIEDAAHSIGASYNGKLIGSIADITTFSFFPTKNLTTGEGGAVSSIHPDLLEKARRFSRQGLIRENALLKYPDVGPWHQEVHDFGLNYRLPDVLCALGISQIKRLPEFKVIRSSIFDNYTNKLQDIESVLTPARRTYVDPVWHLYPIRVEQQMRKTIFEGLRNFGIGVQVNYMPVYWHPVFEKLGFKRGLCPDAEQFYSSEISLPMFVDLTQKQQGKVIECLLGLT